MSIDFSGSFSIRLAHPEDDAAIGELLVQAFVQGYARKLPEVAVSEERKADLRNVAEKRQQGAVLVAERKGRIVGTVTLLMPGALRSEAWVPNSVDLRFLGVDPELRGSGVSARLLDETERLAREWGCDSICLHVRRGAVGIARLYLSRGYVREPKGDLDKLPMIFLEAYRLQIGS